MSFPLLIKLPGGVLVASDSVSAVLDADGIPHPCGYHEKIHLLSDRLPLAITGWGRLQFGVLDRYRARFDGEDPEYSDWTLDRATYSVQEVARRVYDDLVTTQVPRFAAMPADTPCRGWTGWVVGSDSVVRLGVNHAGGHSFTANVLPRDKTGLALPWEPVPVVRDLCIKRAPEIRDMTIEQAAEFAAEIVDTNSEWHAKEPAAHDWLFGGCVSVLVLARGAPPRWIRSLAQAEAA